jgi:hypothetical protein
MSEEGYWLYAMEEPIDEAEAELRARIMRAASLMLFALKLVAPLCQSTWEQPPGSPTNKALSIVHKIIDIAENGTKQDKELEEKFP